MVIPTNPSPNINEQVRDLFTCINEYEEGKIIKLLGQNTLEEMKEKNIRITKYKDFCIETLTNNGTFTFSITWVIIRKRNVTNKHFWHPNIPPKISIFLWKLSLNAIPTESAVQAKGEYLPSKC